MCLYFVGKAAAERIWRLTVAGVTLSINECLIQLQAEPPRGHLLRTAIVLKGRDNQRLELRMTVGVRIGCAASGSELGTLRRDWTREEVRDLFALPFPDLVFAAQRVHRMYFDPRAVQVSTLLSIKTGGCPEDCAYCPQSARYHTGVAATRLMDLEAVLEAARTARDAGASRFCMGAAWRSPKDRDLDPICAMIAGVKALGLETCVTLGMLTRAQAQRLRAAGLDYYNHNIDTSPQYYGRIITTRTYQDRLDTLAAVREAGIRVCCGGIIGMGESLEDRVGMITTLATLPAHPESVPINLLVRVKGTPLAECEPLDPLELVRTVAVARITMPASVVRLSAGREEMSEAVQALCFLAGANSIFYGPKLLTTPNPAPDRDRRLLERLGMVPMGVEPLS
jgi:biotin synthase